MKTQYWYDARELMKDYGLSKNKARSYAWRLSRISEDMAKVETPKNAGEMITKALLGETEDIVKKSAFLMGNIIHQYDRLNRN